MKKAFIVLLFLQIFSFAYSQQSNVIYDESKIPPYTLPDPLIFNDGSRVSSKEGWTKRRSEIYKIFQDEVYGIAPVWKGIYFVGTSAGKAPVIKDVPIRREVKVKLKNGDRELDITILIYLPHSDKPVPVFLGYNFGGNHSVSNDSGISITRSWIANDPENGTTENKATEAGRGKSSSRWPVDEIISRGYGLVTLYYGDIDPDFDDGFKNGVHGLYDMKPGPSTWGSISAWAWGLSRVMDFLVTDPAFDKDKVIVIGHSRLGKAALWAGATDERFSMVISNNSGCGGAALSKRVYGETVGTINSAFPHWFCDNFNKYNEKESSLPVDQHELIALIAPRPVYVASAEEDKWADPKGEFLACVNASPVFALLGYKGFSATEMPAVNSPVMGDIGYHIRNGGHDVKLYDWQRYLDFADYHFSKK